jgi:hypothetical protein
MGSQTPFGVDFVVTWAADRLAISGADFYDPNSIAAIDRAVTGISGFLPFPYPPTYAFLTAPLGFLPYQLALWLWLGLEMIAFFLAMLAITRGRGVLPIAAFPALIIVVVNGQNALIFAALVGAALHLLKKRPVLAGVLIGLASTKPHLGLLIPIALLAGRKWRALASATVTTLLLGAASVLAFGLAPWGRFISVGAASESQLLANSDSIIQKVVTIFATIERFGLGTAMAGAAQLVAFAVAALFVILVWRASAPPAIKNAALIWAGLFATPYLFDYDLALLGPAIAFMAVLEIENGSMPWEASLLAFLWLLPGIARPVTVLTNIPIVPVSLVLAAVVIVARLRRHFLPA